VEAERTEVRHVTATLAPELLCPLQEGTPITLAPVLGGYP
jgi:hypothetical protein